MPIRRFGIALAALVAACGANKGEPASAPSSKESPDARADERIAGEVLLRADPTRIVRQLAEAIGPRVTASPACDRAEAWVASELEKAGLRVHREPYAIASWRPGPFELSLVQPYSAAIAAVPVGWSGSTPEAGVDGPIKVLDTAAIDGADVKGAIVLLRRPEKGTVASRIVARDHALDVARAKGALAILHASAAKVPIAIALCPPAPPGSGASCGLEPLPVAVVGAPEVDKLASYAGIGKARLFARHESSLAGHASNVVAEIPGTGPEVVILGAHLDSVHTSPGASDDGAGVAVLMEIARVLRALDLHPQRTIRFVFFTGEELGMVGSRAYVKAHAAEMPNVAAMVQVDTEGTPLTGFDAFGRDDVKPALERAIAPLAGLGAAHVYDVPSEFLGLACSDHAPFFMAGVPAFFASDQGLVEYHYGGDWSIHTKGDTADKVPAGPSATNAAILAVLVTRLANGPRLAPSLSVAEVESLVKKRHFEDDAKLAGRPELAD